MREWFRRPAGWLSLLALALLLLTVVYSVTQAHWIAPQPALELILLLAVLAGAALSLSRLPGALAHPLALLLGLLVTLGQGVLLQTGPPGARAGALAHALTQWWQATLSGWPSTGTIQIALMFTLFAWLIGYLSVWYLLRRHNPWVPITLGAVALAFNLNFLPARYYIYFLIYLALALGLAVLTTMAEHLAWADRKARLGARYLVPTALVLMAAVLSLAWLTPRAPFQLIEADSPLGEHMNDLLYNFFAPVDAQKPGEDSDRRELAFSDAPRLGGEVSYIVRTARPGYWWVRAYDTYTAQGWEASAGEALKLPGGTAREDRETYQAQRELTYTVIPQFATDVLLLTGEFLRASVASRLETLLPHEVTAARSQEVLVPKWSYEVTALVSEAAPFALYQAGTDYPPWVTSRYLDLPADLPEGLRSLAESLTRGCASPYDRVVAVRSYLAGFPYSLDFGAPAPGQDGVAYFLFEAQRGDCVYFASAAAVLLRAAGVPTRLVSGYLSGAWDEGEQGYRLRQRDRHTWVEVFFPGYGWQVLEATPGAAGTVPAMTVFISPTTGEGIPLPTVSPSTAYPLPPAAEEESLETAPAPNYYEEAPPITISDYAGYTDEYGLPVDGAPYGTLPTPTEGATTEEVPAPAEEARTEAPAVTPGGSGVAPPPGRPPWVGLGAGATLLLLGLTSAQAARRFLNPVGGRAIYRRTCLLATLQGLGPAPPQTALEHAGRLAAAFPAQAAAIQHIAGAYVALRYSREKTLSAVQEKELSASWLTLRRALLARFLRRR